MDVVFIGTLFMANDFMQANTTSSRLFAFLRMHFLLFQSLDRKNEKRIEESEKNICPGNMYKIITLYCC